MKYLTVLALLFSASVIRGTYIIEDKGDQGKIMWGRNYTVKEGDDVKLPCGSRTKWSIKPFRYEWQVLERKFGNKKYEKMVLAYASLKGHTWKAKYVFGIKAEVEPNTRTLDMKNITRYATGTYACSVVSRRRTNGSSKSQYYIEKTFMQVDVKAPARIESRRKSMITLSAGERLDLDCTSSGNPDPKVTWSRSDGRKLPSRRIIYARGLLSVLDLGQTDRGNYTCVAANSMGKDSRTFSLNMKVPARIIQTGPSYATVGEQGSAKCEAVGLPPPAFVWKWYEGENRKVELNENDRRGRFSVKTEHHFEKTVSYLIIKNVKRVDLRDYECRAKNEIDFSYYRVPLRGHAAPGRPTIQAVAPSGTSITISWSYGDNGGKEITSVIIQYSRLNNSESKNITLDNPQVSRYTIKGLKEQTQYIFQVYAVNEVGVSAPSANLYGKTQLIEDTQKIKNNERIPDTKSLNMTVMIGGVAGGFLVLIVAIIIVCILMRNIQRNSAKKAAENEQRAAQSANQDATALINFLQRGGERLSSPGSGGSVPSTGETLPLTASNRWEFPRERLVLQNILGSGAFGIVMKAEADGIKGLNSGTIPVAVKFVKENESASAKKDLVAELELLKLIEPHTNVINLLGCCTRSEPLMVIVEFCAYGDLQSFLRSSRGIRDPYYIDCYKRPSSRLTSKELLMFGTQIARGMAHLACLKVIHRDLAARNILVDENKVCKVSDFGFARDIYVEDHYTRKTAGGRFPIKWMAIESLLDGISTTKSDVWSFAIVLWEIITLGASPYPGMNSQEVVSFLQNGMRMDKPKHCSDELYNLLLDCWQVASHRRPNFEMLARYLDKMYNDDFEYINMRTYDDHLYINFDGNTISGGSNSAGLLKQDGSGSSQPSQNSGDSTSGR